jgi:Tol biopolymer transport system component
MEEPGGETLRRQSGVILAARPSGSYNPSRLALTPGTRLGVYEVTALIGEGGMGQVFRATDTKLKRQVAIKILPPSVAADAERLARFQREAEVLASLTHPNIAAIYGLEESGGLTALVMELVEGDDLSQRIARGALPLDEALPLARQIAEALEAAHEQGIIHRDLKPANIKVRGDGTVKVLDFGLAKAMEPTGALSASASMSPTITTPAMTQAGMILGTAAYMSPEQAKGRTVDTRSDVWAFGAVLYEMLTGTRAFPGEEVSEVLASVLAREPDWTRVPAMLSPALATFLRRCLHKNPKQRIGSLQDVRLALEGAFETAAPQTTAATSSASRGRLVWMAACAAAAVVMVSLAIPALRYVRETPSPETRVDIVTPATDEPASFAISPDGRQFVFVASGDGASRLWLRSLATATAQPLAGTEDARHPFWSPDSRSVGFFAGDALKRLDLGSATPHILAMVNAGSGGTWNRDGVIVFAGSATGALLTRVSATGGAVTVISTLGPQQQSQRGPHFLPDGHRFLFYVLGRPDTAGIYLGTLDGSAPTRLTPADNPGVYLPSGWLLWVRGGTLFAQRLDVAHAALVGAPTTLADGVAGENLQNSAVTVSATGLVAYRAGALKQRQLTWFDRSGTARGTVGAPDGNNLRDPRVSPDGRRVVVQRTLQGNSNLWLLDGARINRFTFDAAHDDRAVWSPDGTRIVFRSNRSGPGDLYQKLTTGAGVEERLVASDQAKSPSSWSGDGRFLLYHSTDPQTYTDLWVLPMEGDRKPSVVLKTPFRELWGRFSPDGRWVAYQSSESGRPEIYIRPFIPPGATSAAASTAAGQWQVSTEGGAFPVWRPDGKELYYLNTAGAMIAAPITVTGTTLAPGAPVVLFLTRVWGGGVDVQQGWQYDVAPDGRFLINTELESAAAPITLLMNWNPESQK